MIDIALMGRAGSGKDTVARYLVQVYGYRRIAFADPLRSMALAVDPIISADAEVGGAVTRVVRADRLSDVVGRLGWEGAKRHYPEVRRFLQRLGLEGVREHLGDDTWVEIAIAEISRIRADRMPVVVTDVRFRNELDALRRWNFLPVWVERPGVSAGSHLSEAELGPEDADHVVYNDSSPAELYEQVEEALRKI